MATAHCASIITVCVPIGTASSYSLDLRVSVEHKTNPNLQALQDRLKSACKSTLTDLFLHQFNKLEIEPGFPHTLSPDSYTIILKHLRPLVTDIDIIGIRVEIPIVKKTITVRGMTRDRTPYSAALSIVYHKHNPKHIHNPSTRESKLERAPVDYYRDQFIESWSTKTLGDLIETFSKRTSDERDAFESGLRAKIDKEFDGLTIICVTYTMDPTTKTNLITDFKERQCDREVLAFWYFILVLGFAGGLIYSCLLAVQKQRHRWESVRRFGIRQCNQYYRSMLSMCLTIGLWHLLAGAWTVVTDLVTDAVAQTYIILPCSIVFFGPLQAAILWLL